MKPFCLIFFIIIFIAPMSFARESAVKYGYIHTHQIWSGQIDLVGDIVIDHGVTVTIKPGTILRFANYDIKNYGENPSHTEIIVNGAIDAQSPSDNPIIVQHIHSSSFKPLIVDDTNTVLHFQPYEVDTTNMQQEFKSFKMEYFIFWAVTYLMWIIRGG